MSPALKAALTRLGTLLLATVAGSGVQPAVVRAQADTQQVPAGPNDEATVPALRAAVQVASSFGPAGTCWVSACARTTAG